MKREKVLEAYSEYISEFNERPKSIAAFAKNIQLEESDIYEHYASFSIMEAQIMNHFVENAISLTRESLNELNHAIAKESLLTFYYSLSEVLTANRSLVLFLMRAEKTHSMNLKKLKVAKSSFLQFFNDLNYDIVALSFIPDSAIKAKTKETAVWGQFCSILFYWLKDESPNFEKTDVFIEKSLKLTFDIAESNVAESFIDFGKFLFKKT
ncbi:MAG: hypothetical protein ACI8XB_001445 [Patiriisocius sp.]|jgi:hypothetical protein